MIEIISSFIDENNLIPKNTQTVFTAVSGGIDSCVLLHVLNQLRKKDKFDLQLIHFNHQTRGSDNIKDERFVERLAKEYHLPMKLGRYSGQRIKKSEGYLRTQRYKFFNNILKYHPSSLIATAHNADDNVETFLMRMVRGSRLKGLVGIRPKRGSFIHPLLAVDRQQIVQYAKDNEIEYREDITNKDNSITRNKLRNEIIPLLEKIFGENLKHNILKIINDLSLHYSLYTEQLQNAIKQTVKKSKYGLALNRKKYSTYNVPLRRGLIEYCISIIQPLNYSLSDKNFILWDNFIKTSAPGKKNNIFEAGYALAERKEIVFGNFPADRKEKYSLSPNSEVIIDNKYRITLTPVSKETVTFMTDKNVEIIDGEKSGSKLYVRFWQKGDVFHPLGMRNKRKLSDFFIDLKLSTTLKKEVPIICNNDKIIWIAGYRLDDQFKVSESTKIFYKMTLSEVKLNDKN